MHKSEILDSLFKEYDRLGRAIEKTKREMTEVNTSCQGPQDSIDRSIQCACQLEFQLKLDRLQQNRARFNAAIEHVRTFGPLCSECEEDITKRVLKLGSTLCCACATEAERHIDPTVYVRRTMYVQL